jgi:hypothetical protein
MATLAGRKICLIFPEAPRLYKHECPDVENTFAPFFMRALQAIETETPANAARWAGSLLHFQTDAGSPPHAASLSGEIHSKMENWVVASAISISGYQPRLLGRTPDGAVRGFEQRMAGLIAFSKQRAQRLYPLIIANDRPAAEPIVLESADESARVEADLLHTLLFLSETKSSGIQQCWELEATVTAPTVANFESLPAKLVIAGTNYSTMSELVTIDKGRYKGVFLLRNVRPGTYHVIVSRVGATPLFINGVVIRSRAVARFNWSLEPDSLPGNLVRNPDFKIRWRSTDPDYWTFDKDSGSWVSDNVRVHGGTRYRFQASFQKDKAPDIMLQWYKNHWQACSDAVPLAPANEVTLVAPENAQYARLFVRTKDDPARSVMHIAFARLTSDSATSPQ